MSSLILSGGSIAVATPFNKSFVDDLKAQVPYSGRRWNAPTKQWLVDPQYGTLVATLIRQYFGEQVAVPVMSASACSEIKTTIMYYLGRCKMRDDGNHTASGYADTAWSLSFPEQVLRSYFNDDTTPAALESGAAPPSLYAALGVPAFAEFNAIKAAFRRLAKVWHPDVTREPDAKERFQTINRAYDVLKDGPQRRKYDVGLTLELRAAKQETAVARSTIRSSDYRAPLTCGLVMVEGVERLGVLHVAKILHWADVTNAAGETMVASWPLGADTFETRWV